MGQRWSSGFGSGAGLLILGFAASSCEAILGIKDVSLDPIGGGGAGAAGGTGGAGAVVSAEASSSSSGSGNGGGSGAGGSPVMCTTPSDCGANTECIAYACVSSVCSKAIVLTGTACKNGSGIGKCDTTGECVQCLDASHCPQPINQCQAAFCNGGVCSIGNLPAATFCNGAVDQCDGAGNCVDCVDNGGCGECCACVNRACIPT
jgi:hypothetical protein